tara:strand:- start:2132 stop:2362 length:231 start_codon:yes stop_codon:yes gene_type:complete
MGLKAKDVKLKSAPATKTATIMVRATVKIYLVYVNMDGKVLDARYLLFVRINVPIMVNVLKMDVTVTWDGKVKPVL